MTIVTVLVVLALLCFLIGSLGIQFPQRCPNWTAAGLALLTLAYLITKS